MNKRLPKGRYATRAAAGRAARAACRKVMKSPRYPARSRHDYRVIEDFGTVIDGVLFLSTFRFELAGPVEDAASATKNAAHVQPCYDANLTHSSTWL